MPRIAAIVSKKRDGTELTYDEIELFVKSVGTRTIRDAQTGAMVMAWHLKGISYPEMEMLAKAMLFSGQQLQWPKAWSDSVGSLQSTGSTGNKAKLILGAAMAACGVKFPILPARGMDVVAGILNKMRTIPNFNASLDLVSIQKILTDVGCCVALQPQDVAPAERLIRDVAAIVGTFQNNSLKAACLVARLSALKFHGCVVEITCGPGEAIKTEEDAQDLIDKVKDLVKIMGVKCKLLLTKVDRPVGKMVGQSLELAEAFRCVNGDGPQDLHELVCKLGGHLLHQLGKVEDPTKGQEMVDNVMKDGSARKKMMDMMQAQGVEKGDVKSLFKHRKGESDVSSVFPTTHYSTHLSVDKSGFVNRIDMSILDGVMYRVATARNAQDVCAGGIQLLVQVGSPINKGDVWAKMSSSIRLTEDEAEQLKAAVIVSEEAPSLEMNIDIKEV